MLLLTILGYYILFHFMSFLAILNNFNIWLFVTFLLGLLVIILLVVIDGYFIAGYWWLLMAIILVVIGDY